ncbi:dihydropteroate synthase [Amycolatopsis deserti]|uniref:dihydropteroate synthase n=1 Tax=Amycolatopsis deserti TaxID=185696 RepID=A0ABQ3IDJ5_9PSEU|nr:dihydropteroate synthase [Amycolatopsis deserti]GHE80465.1 dihydropteroate synthase [Amycolatopsis deserti]
MTLHSSLPRLLTDGSRPTPVRSDPRPLKVMGILNATPDSFWQGSRYPAVGRAIEAGEEMFALGAWAVDIGGESTRPGAAPVSPAEELERIAPIVAALAGRGRVSVDTRHAEVAEEAVRLGASIINDVSGSLCPVAARTGAGYVGMHSHTVPVSVDGNPVYDDVHAEVAAHLSAIAAEARQEGVGDLWIDPGIGFGKSVEDNLELLRRLRELSSLGVPVLVGVSRKSFIGRITGRDVGDRLAGSLALIAPAWTAGVDVIRVHDVEATLDTIAMLDAVWGRPRT